MVAFSNRWRRSGPEVTTKLNAQDRVILFCAATGIDHAAVGIPAHAMQSIAIRGQRTRCAHGDSRRCWAEINPAD
jgi:hypothetical protein